MPSMLPCCTSNLKRRFLIIALESGRLARISASGEADQRQQWRQSCREEACASARLKLTTKNVGAMHAPTCQLSR
jgi:succinate dehydrogenase/fumarate reductase-like Fe-S protein